MSAGARRPPLERFLVITADDFGLHEDVNEAVERASRTGVLSAASLMVSAPAAQDAVRRALRLPDLRVGLHVVLADGMATLPAERIPDLCDAQGRMDERMLSRGVRFFFSGRARRQIEAEVRAQLEAFARTGLALDHIDAHKHFQLHPTLLGILMRAARDHGAPAIRVPAEPYWFAAQFGASGARASACMLAPFAALMKRRLHAARVLCNDHLFGIAASGAMTEDKLLAVLARLPRGTSEIYLHPAVTSGAVIGATMAGYRHADELASLLSPRVLAAAAPFARGGYADAGHAARRAA